jgi:Tfp pilus assembly protein PilE
MTDAQARADNAARQTAMATLTANAAEIAKFLSGANPYLTENAVNGLLVAHSAHHAAQIQQVMAGDVQAEAVTWKAMQAHMDTLADALAGAIARQFPHKAS